MLGKGGVSATHKIRDGYAEMIEVQASESCQIINIPLEKLHLPPGVVIALLKRGEDIILPDKETIIKSDDIMLIFATQQAVPFVEKLFSFNFDLV